MPIQDWDANAAKKAVDRLAGDLQGIDRAAVEQHAREAADIVRRHTDPNDMSQRRIIICGPAGAGKTTFSQAFSRQLEIPSFDLDEYIPGGWTMDEGLYKHRYKQGLQELWQDLSFKRGWTIEHVEAANPDLVSAFRPAFAIRIDPGSLRLMRAAQARAAAANDPLATQREMRALQTAVVAHEQFGMLKGRKLGEGEFWTLKDVRPDQGQILSLIHI